MRLAAIPRVLGLLAVLTIGVGQLRAHAVAPSKASPSLHIATHGKTAKDKKNGGLTKFLTDASSALADGFVMAIRQNAENIQLHIASRSKQPKTTKSYAIRMLEKIKISSKYSDERSIMGLKTAHHAARAHVLAAGLAANLPRFGTIIVSMHIRAGPEGCLKANYWQTYRKAGYIDTHEWPNISRVRHIQASLPCSLPGFGVEVVNQCNTGVPYASVQRFLHHSAGRCAWKAMFQPAIPCSSSSPELFQSVVSAGQSWIKIAKKSDILRFTIDPLPRHELLAHGAVGARNALRCDRSRNNWA
jgi:hypothetical protein